MRHRKPASQSLRDFGQYQKGFMIMSLFGGLWFWTLARMVDGPVLQVEAYGPFIMGVRAEVWAIPLALGSALSLMGQVVNGDPRICPWVTPSWRLVGALVVFLDMALFAVGGFYAPTYQPIFAYSVFGAGACLWFVKLALGDLMRGLGAMRYELR